MVTFRGNSMLAESLLVSVQPSGFARRRALNVLVVVCIAIACGVVAEVRPFALFEPEALVAAWTFLRKLFPPDFSTAFLGTVAVAVGQTLTIAIAGTALSIIIGLPL